MLVDMYVGGFLHQFLNPANTISIVSMMQLLISFNARGHSKYGKQMGVVEISCYFLVG